MHGLTEEEVWILGITEGMTAKAAQWHLLRTLAQAHLKRAGGNQCKAADRMGVHRNTIARLLKKEVSGG